MLLDGDLLRTRHVFDYSVISYKCLVLDYNLFIKIFICIIIVW